MSAAKKSGSFPYGLIVMSLVLVLLFATNPDEQQFKSYLKDRIIEQAKDDESLEGDLTRILSGPAASLAGMVTSRTNYYLFSTYELGMSGDEILYLGILDQFIRLKK
jgi:hypothetical protein